LQVYYNVDMLAEWAAEVEDNGRRKAIAILKVAKKLLSMGDTDMSIMEADKFVMSRYKIEKFYRRAEIN